MRLKKLDLTEVVQGYGKALFRYAYTILCDYHAAEDLVQDVFIAAYQNQDRFDGDNIAAWLHKIIYNKSIDHLRRQRIISFQTLQKGTLPVDPEYDTGYTFAPYLLSLLFDALNIGTNKRVA